MLWTSLDSIPASGLDHVAVLAGELNLISAKKTNQLEDAVHGPSDGDVPVL